MSDNESERVTDGDRQESDSEDELEEEDPSEQQFFERRRAARDTIKRKYSRHSGKNGEKEAQEFLKEFSDIASQPHPELGNLLHEIVDLVKQEASIKSKGLTPLIRQLIEKYPDHVRTANGQDQNPLYRAIGYKRHQLVQSILDSCKGTANLDQALDDALEMKCNKEADKTCLHLALEKDLRAGVTQAIIERATHRSLSVQDEKGRTPLHYAVAYGQCDEERVETIKAFVRRDQKLLKTEAERHSSQPIETVRTFLDITDESQKSVYREHEASAIEWRRQNPDESAKGKENLAPVPPRPLRAELNPQPSDAHLRPDRMSAPRRDEAVRQPSVADRDTRDRGPRPSDKDRDSGRPEPAAGVENQGKGQQGKGKENKNVNARDQDQHTDRARGRPGIAAPETGGKRLREHALAVRTTELARNDLLQFPTDGPKLRNEPEANTPLKRTPTLNPELVEEKDRQKQKGEPGKKKSSTDAKKYKTTSKDLAGNSEKVLKLLKLHYMRTRSIERTTSFLYGKNSDDIQIFFDYRNLPRKITKEDITNFFGANRQAGIALDEVLKYVRFTNVTVTPTGRNNVPREVGTLGRWDMEIFFDWLHKKGVHRILELTVEDTGPKAHNDESIENCLSKVIVEHLDWQKPDLDPQIFTKIGVRAGKECTAKEDNPGAETERLGLGGHEDSLKTLTLRWSGNNAILRAWSGADGLPLLKKLQTINIHLPASTNTYDSQKRMSCNINEFAKTLNENVKRIASAKSPEKSGQDKGKEAAESSLSKRTSDCNRKVVVNQIQAERVKERKAISNSATPTPTMNKPKNTHEWLECMNAFAKNINPFWAETLRRFKSVTEGEVGVNDDVVVALIDDGVDVCDKSFGGDSILKGKTFDYHDHGSVGPYYVSADGHGTKMAKHILQVCPMAKIYPIRLKTKTSPDGKTQIVAKSAAMAIEAALEKGAQIISMSWTVPMPTHDSEEKILLKEVLQKACKEEVLMFCSSPDSGQFTDKDYPTAYHRESFFRIGAAHDDGTAYARAGFIKDLDFIFPGVKVTDPGAEATEWPVSGDERENARFNEGSSIATALAAGLAAVIVYCFKASALASQTASSKDTSGIPITVENEWVNKIVKLDVMKEAFHRIGAVTDGHYIQVWDTFDEVNKRFNREVNDDKGYNAKLRCIQNLCKNLVKHELH